MAILVAGLFILFAGIVIMLLSSLKIPDFSSFSDRKITNSTQIYDRTGQILLYNLNTDVKRTDINLDQMSINIQNATIAIEDSQFYTENGIRVSSIIRAALADIFGGQSQGGSTITQQLVKNTLLTQDKSYIRKIKEWVLAVKIDKSMSKQDILQDYLNEIWVRECPKELVYSHLLYE